MKDRDQIMKEFKESFGEVINFMDADITERERKIIAMRHGWDDGVPKTLEEVGREFGLTRERIRQIESKAAIKLEHKARISKWLEKTLDRFEYEIKLDCVAKASNLMQQQVAEEVEQTVAQGFNDCGWHSTHDSAFHCPNCCTKCNPLNSQ